MERTISICEKMENQWIDDDLQKDDNHSSEDECEVLEEGFTVRPYQQLLIDVCMKGNSIILLPTGTGKTLIAFSVFKNLIDETRGEYPQVARRSIFLAPTKVLIEQQKNEFDKFMKDPTIKSIFLHGDLGTDNYSKETWEDYLKNYNIFFFTPKVFEIIIGNRFLTFHNINAIVFDECHHAYKKKGASKHSYKIITEFYKEHKSKTKIVGLSASLVNNISPNNFEKTVSEIESIYQAKIFSGDASLFIKDAKTFVVSCGHSSFKADIKNSILKAEVEILAENINISLEDLFKSANEMAIETKFKNSSTNVQYLLYENGPWFAIEGISFILEKLKNSTQPIEKCLQNLMFKIKERLTEIFRAPHWNDRDFLVKSPIHKKIKELLKVVNAFPKETSGMVFVERRLVANILYRYIKEYAQNIPNMNHIKPGFYIGKAAKDHIKFDFNHEDYKESFNNSEMNLMIATSVFEEGIDVPSCKFVIRFDFPQNFRAYVQSRGRARQQDAAFFLMVDFDDQGRKRKLLNDYRQIEICLKKYKPSMNDSIQALNADFGQERYFTSENACLLESEAKGILAKYLSIHSAYLENHLFTHCIQSDKSSNLYTSAFWYPFNCKLFGFESGAIFPKKADAQRNCAFKACIKLIEAGEISPHFQCNKAIPFIPEDCYEELSLEIKKLNPELLKRTVKLYEQTNSDFTRLLSGESFHSEKTHYTLYCVEFEDKLQDIFSHVRKLKFGFLSSKPFPVEKCSFPICLNEQVINVTVTSINQRRIPTNSDMMTKLLFFSEHINKYLATFEFDNQWPKLDEMKDDYQNLSSSNLIIVPLDEANNIDFGLISEVEVWRSTMLQKNSDIPSIVQDIDIESINTDTALTFSHHQRVTFYRLNNDGEKRHCDNLMSNEENSPKTFKEYFMKTYQLDIDGDLYHMQEYRKILKMFKTNISEQKPTSKASTRMHNFFPLKSAVSYPVPIAEMLMFNCVTLIIYRLEQHFRAFDFLERFKFDMNLPTGMPEKTKTSNSIPSRTNAKFVSINVNHIEKFSVMDDLKIQICDGVDYSDQIGEYTVSELLQKFKFQYFGMATCFVEKLEKPLQEYENLPGIYSLEHSHFHLPNPSDIVTALTLDKVHDSFSNEQLETIGDAFLKMTTCLFLYFKYLKFNEGRLTYLKGIMVSNENLFYLAKQKELTKYIFGNVIQLGKNWKSKFMNENTTLEQQELALKNIADCVEALMGTFFINGSFDALLCFFNWIGLKSFDPTVETIPDPIVECQKQIDEIICELNNQPNLEWCREQFANHDILEAVEKEYKLRNLSQVEKIIGYTFKKKFYLVQAFTHSSYSSPLKDGEKFKINLIESNERLEFIGDSILDFLIIIKIFEANDQLTPGEMTGLKSALVNNDFFSALIIKFGLHKFLRYSLASFETEVNIYVDYFKQVMYAQQCSLLNLPFDLKLPAVKAPKILSDIFESLVGAIYLDNGFNLDELWKIVFHLMRPEFEYFNKIVPKNPIDKVSKLFPGRFEFTDPEIHEDHGRSCELIIYTDTTMTNVENKYEGFGTNKVLCRLSASQKCLYYLN